MIRSYGTVNGTCVAIGDHDLNDMTDTLMVMKVVDKIDMILVNM